jgi:hypothetical protein
MINCIGKLRHDITRNESLPSCQGDLDWEALIASIDPDRRKWFEAPWLIVECLMYKILNDLRMEHLPLYDLFAGMKSQALESSLFAMENIASKLISKLGKIDSSMLKMLIHGSLWGNQSDLSLIVDKPEDPAQENILADDTLEIIDILMRSNNVIIVLDNAGFELFCDLCLALALSYLGCKVTLYHKCFPWFVSDTTAADYTLLLDSCSNHGGSLAQLAAKFSKCIENGAWQLAEDNFWTLGYSYWYLESKAPNLLEKLAAADFIFLKGDLNYRKV